MSDSKPINEDAKPTNEAKKKVEKIAATDKKAFKNILKAAVGKLLSNLEASEASEGKQGTKKSTSKDKFPSSSSSTSKGSLPSSSSSTYLDVLLKSLETTESPDSEDSRPSVNSLDDLIKSLSRKNSQITTLRSSSEPFLDRLLNRRIEKKNPSRRQNQSKLDRLLASFESSDDEDYEGDYSVFLPERPRSFSRDDYFEDNFSSRRTDDLRSALRSSRRLEEDLEHFLRKLERQRQ